MKDHNEDNTPMSSLFNGLDKIFNVVADMVDQNKDRGNNKVNIQKEMSEKYGVNIKVGMIGRDFWNSPGNPGNAAEKERATKIITPSTDIFEEEDRLIIVMELPGVEKEDAKVTINENRITLTAKAKEVCYKKEITLAFEPEDTVKDYFNNSIYSIEVRKR